MFTSLFRAAARRSLWGFSLLTLAWTARGQYDPDWSRNIRIGFLAGFNIKADFRMSGTFPIFGTDPGLAGMPRQNHVYDDGYVRVDATGNAGTDPRGGYTTFWGYQDGSQHPSASTLLFHNSSFFTGAFSSARNEDAHRANVVERVDPDLLALQLAEDAVDVLRPTTHIGREPRGLQLAAQ